jgi:serine/threonine protein phosphatase PrpC
VTRFDQIEYTSLTDVGVRRSHNQDNHAVLLAGDDDQWRQRGHLFLVADGMGAHAVGEKASEQAASVIPHTYGKHAQHGPAPALRKAFVEANASIHACGQANREFEGMGTTATALLLRPEGAWVSHVGDSRVYRIRGGIIEQLSYDHSLVWEYARLKHIDPEEVEDIPSNVIHRCLGPEPLVQVDVEGPHTLHSGDIFLLCSDGLSGQVSDPEIGAVASCLSPAEACRFLIDLANLRGGPDNITVMIVKIGDGPAANGVPAPLPPPQRRLWSSIPWWVFTLCSGIGLIALAAYLQFSQTGGVLAVFLLAACAILSGLVGLFMHSIHEKRLREHEDDDDPPQARIHRSSTCRIDAPLLDKLARAVEVLKQRSDEQHWEPDLDEYQRHCEQAAEQLRANDLSGTFREFCRAMLPLTKALGKHRKKEEVFSPIWDKTPRPRGGLPVPPADDAVKNKHQQTTGEVP